MRSLFLGQGSSATVSWADIYFLLSLGCDYRMGVLKPENEEDTLVPKMTVWTGSQIRDSQEYENHIQKTCHQEHTNDIKMVARTWVQRPKM